MFTDIHSIKYKSISSGFGVLMKEQGVMDSSWAGCLPCLVLVLKAHASFVCMSSSRSITQILLAVSMLDYIKELYCSMGDRFHQLPPRPLSQSPIVPGVSPLITTNKSYSSTTLSKGTSL